MAALLFTFGQILGQQQGYQKEAAAKHQRDAKSYVAEACADAETASLFECVYDAAEAAQESQRSEQDLHAQQGMHLWTASMVIVGLLQTGVAAGALFLLMKDLRQNRESAELQLRAYLSVTKVTFQGGRAPNKIKATVHFRNDGQTPAKEVEVFLGIYALDWREYRPADMPAVTGGPFLKSKAVVGSGDTRTITNDVGLREGLHQNVALRTFCLIAQGHINYRDIFGKPQRTTYKVYADDVTRQLGHPSVAAPDGNTMT